MQNIVQPQPPQQAVKPPDERAPEQPTPSRQSRQMRVSILGIVFIVAGLASLLAIVTQSVLLGIMVVPLLGVMFLAVAIVSGRYAAFIPGGILTGLGIGLLVYQLWLTQAPSGVQGAIPVIGLGLGFAAITPLCWYFDKAQVIWPLFPGAILLISGVGLLFGATLWGEIGGPLVLLAAGCYLIFWRASHPRARHIERHHGWRHLFGADQ